MSDLRTPAATVVGERGVRPFSLGVGQRHGLDVVFGGEHTGGSQAALLDQRGRQGDARLMHVHRREAEVFYMIEGAITAWAGEAAVTLSSGGAVYLPAGLPHALRRRSPSSLKSPLVRVRHSGVLIPG